MRILERNWLRNTNHMYKKTLNVVKTLTFKKTTTNANLRNHSNAREFLLVGKKQQSIEIKPTITSRK